jgi:hypothetical protein
MTPPIWLAATGRPRPPRQPLLDLWPRRWRRCACGPVTSAPPAGRRPRRSTSQTGADARNTNARGPSWRSARSRAPPDMVEARLATVEFIEGCQRSTERGARYSSASARGSGHGGAGRQNPRAQSRPLAAAAPGIPKDARPEAIGARTVGPEQETSGLKLRRLSRAPAPLAATGSARTGVSPASGGAARSAGRAARPH